MNVSSHNLATKHTAYRLIDFSIDFHRTVEERWKIEEIKLWNNSDNCKKLSRYANYTGTKGDRNMMVLELEEGEMVR